MMDEIVLSFFNRTLSNPYLDILFVSLTTKGYLLFLPFLVYLFFLNKDKRLYLFYLALIFTTFALNDWFSTEIKSVFERIRPCHFGDYINVIGCSDSFSMPSNHASNAFAFATILIYLFRSERASLFISTCPLIIAVLISISRVYLGVHYPSDVIVGALLGFTIAITTINLFKRLQIYYKKSPVETIMFVLIIALSLFRIYYIRHGGIDLSPDEAHYWEWSRRLDWSYYSKGPLVAWLIGLTRNIFGDTVISIRILAVIMLSLGSIIIYSLTREIANSSVRDESDSKKAGLIAFLCMQIIPLFSVYGIVFTIDSPLILLWSCSLYFFYKAIKNENDYKNWILLGFFIGLGLLAKYTMSLFIICGFIYLFITEKKLLAKPYPYLALLICLLVFSPVIYWNFINDWVTVKHTAGQAHIDSGFSLSISSFFEFIGSQFGVITPLLFIMLLSVPFKIHNIVDKKAWIFLLSFSLPVLILFLLKSLQGKVQANWAMPGYISLLIAFAIIWSKDILIFQKEITKKTKILITAFLIALLVNIAGLYPHFFQIPAKLDPSARLRGWSNLAKEVDKLRDNLQKSGESILIFSDSYQVASEMAFYLKGNPITYCINFTNRRMNQYDLWEDPNQAIKRLKVDNGNINGIFVGSTVLDYSGELANRCERYDKTIIRVFQKGRLINSHFVFICYNLTSLPHQMARNY